MLQSSAKCLDSLAFRPDQRLCREAVRDDQRIHPPLLHQLLHVAAYGRDDRRFGQSMPIDAVKREGIIRIPEDRDLISHLCLA
jgi:hypothetical protein